MHTLQLFRRIGPLDAKMVGRDSMLRWMIAIPVVIALAIRFVLPSLLERIGVFVGMNINDFYPLLASGPLLLITPAIYGTVIGFLLLDQRDEHTLTAIRVTPVSLGTYLAYRLIAPTVLSVVMTPVAFVIVGLPQFSPASVLLASVSAAPIAPLLTLAFTALAENKVQGIALQKALSVLLVLPLGGLLAPAPWAWLFGLLPTTWPLWALWAEWPWSLAVLGCGLAFHTLLLGLLGRGAAARS